MKKPVLLITLLALALSFSACNVNESKAESSTSDSSATEQTETVKIKELKLPDDFRIEKPAAFDYDFETEALDDFGHERELPELSQDEYNKLYDSLKAMGFTMDGESDEWSSRYYFYKNDELFVIDEEYTNPSYNMMAWYKASSKYTDSSPQREQIIKLVREAETENYLNPGFDCVIDVSSDALYEQMGLKYVYVPSKNSYLSYAAQSYLVGINGAEPVGTAGRSGDNVPFLCDIDDDGEFEVIFLTSAFSGESVPVIIAYGVNDGKPYEKYHQYFRFGLESSNALLMADKITVSDDGKSFGFNYKTELTGEIKSYRVEEKDGELVVIEE